MSLQVIFPPPKMLTTCNKGFVRPCKHVSRGSTHSAGPDRVESFIGSRRTVASIFCRSIHANCSSELAGCMPLPLPGSRCTRLSTFGNPCTYYPNSLYESSLLMANSFTAFQCLDFLLPLTCISSRRVYQDTSPTECRTLF